MFFQPSFVNHKSSVCFDLDLGPPPRSHMAPATSLFWCGRRKVNRLWITIEIFEECPTNTLRRFVTYRTQKGIEGRVKIERTRRDGCWIFRGAGGICVAVGLTKLLHFPLRLSWISSSSKGIRFSEYTAGKGDISAVFGGNISRLGSRTLPPLILRNF